MKLKFNPAAHQTEWRNGNIYYKNEGAVITVDRFRGERMLKQICFDRFGTEYKVFVLVSDKDDESEAVKEPIEINVAFPEGFPQKDLLIDAGWTAERLKSIDRAALLEIQGIGPKSADAIEAALKEIK